MSDEKLCDDCGHKEHEPGRCEFDNCGESGIVHLSGYRELTILSDPAVKGSSMTLYGYDCGHRVTRKAQR